MRRRSRHQLVLDPTAAEEPSRRQPRRRGLSTALADLLLEALGKQNNAIPVEREVRDASQDHA
jgi:hypothetical protein